MGSGIDSVTTSVLLPQVVAVETSSFVRKHAAKLVASVLITAGVIYTAEKGGLKLVPDSGDFSQVRWHYVALYIPLFMGMTWFRSVRWRFLLRSIITVPKLR